MTQFIAGLHLLISVHRAVQSFYFFLLVFWRLASYFEVSFHQHNVSLPCQRDGLIHQRQNWLSLCVNPSNYGTNFNHVNEFCGFLLRSTAICEELFGLCAFKWLIGTKHHVTLI